MKKFLQNPIVFGIFLLLSVLFFVSLSRSANKTQQYALTIETFDESIKALEQKNEQLKKDLYTATNSAERERIIREELLLQKPNEHIFILPVVKKDEEISVVESSNTIFDKWRSILQF